MKKSMNYINFSMERYNLITHNDFKPSTDGIVSSTTTDYLK